jgi:hypothetical protein
MEQRDSQLPAADVTLDAATLDRIDPIVALGVTINPADNNYGEQVSQPGLRGRWLLGSKRLRVRGFRR